MRSEGWESRLYAIVDSARFRQFDARTWNCAVFARTCVAAVSGRDDLPTRLSGTIEQTVDRLFPRVEKLRAMRGDVVLADIPEPSLGVCVGRQAAFLGVSGLVHIPMRKARIAWSV